MDFTEKRILVRLLMITCFVLLNTGLSYAQSTRMRLGFNMSTMLEKDDDEDYSETLTYTYSPSLNFGFIRSFPGSLSNIGFESGIVFSVKGVKGEETGVNPPILFKLNLGYIEIPTNLIYKLPGGFELNGGLYVAAGAAGSLIRHNPGGNAKSRVTIRFDEFRRFDFGTCSGLGYSIRNTTFNLNYDHGLYNISKSKIDNYRLKNRTFSFSVTFEVKQKAGVQ